MKRLPHILVLDPIAFAGGSKISTRHVLSLLEHKKVRISILSADVKSWQALSLDKTHLATTSVTPLFMPTALQKTEQGIGFFIRHFIIAAQLLWLRIFTARIDTALAASGPGVDYALYLVKSVLGFRLIQMVHGPVANSGTIARALNAANQVFYLNSTQASLSNALKKAGYFSDIASAPQFHSFRNGLAEPSWPSPCQYRYSVVFWAASLLKWKGLDTLLNALSHLPSSRRPETHVCYIRPQQQNLPVSLAPQTLSNVFWHQQPPNLDTIRAHANIFVSTSTNEPFGLSILEAMAAGMCVIIPADDAFWDNQLAHGVNCLKYPAGNESALAETLLLIQNDIKKIQRLGLAAMLIAKKYRAETCFAEIAEALLSKAPPCITRLPSGDLL